MLRKKKRGEKEKKVRKKCLNEQETVSYEQQILDNNRQLSRLRSRNEELEAEVKALNNKFEQLQEDRSDVVAHLKRNLEDKTEEARELNERLLALEELRKQEQAECKKKENAMELEYRTMESNLSAEVKLAAGKLNALEDWRLARLDLMHKFEVQEKQIEEQEELHRTKLYETEKSVIVAKAKMQKEMEERLKQLAQDFKRATNIRIADVMHNAIRRNVALNHELNSMLTICQDLEMETAESKDNDRILRLQCELYETEAKIALNDAIRKKEMLHEIAQEKVDTYLKYGQMQRKNAKIRNFERLIKQYKEQCVTSQGRAKVLEQQLENTKKAKEEILVQVQIKCKEFNKLNKLLNEARQCVLEVLQLQEHVCTRDTCTLCTADSKQNLIYSLQNILEKHVSNIIEE